MSEIFINKEPFAKTVWYSGTYTDKDSDNFDFNICADESAAGVNVTQIKWGDEAPADYEQIEDRIKEKFKE